MTTKNSPLAAIKGGLLILIKHTQNPDQTMNLHQAASFLAVATHAGDPLSIGEIGEQIGMTTSTASHTIAALSEFKAYQRKGMGLLIVRPDLVERRKKLVSLSPFGVKVADEIGRQVVKYLK